MKRKSWILPVVTAVSTFVLLSCGGGNNSGQQANQESAAAEFDAAKSEIISGINEVIKELPPPSEVPYLLMATGADFDPSVTNAIDKVKSYLNPAAKAATNLGVYLTDVGYVSSYEKAQESLNYVGACQQLAEAIGVAGAMDLELVSRFEKNLNNKDSLKSLVDEVIFRANERLDAMERINVAGYILSGTFIEGLYISTQLIQKYPTDLPAQTRSLILNPLVKIVIDQKMALENLIKVMDQLKEDEASASLLADFQKIKAIYDGELAEVTKQISENTGDLNLNPSVLANLTSTTSEIRSKYTN